MSIKNPVQATITGSKPPESALLNAVTVTGAGASQAVDQDILPIEVVCAGTFAVKIEGSRDNATWYTLTCYTTAAGATTSITASGLYAVDTSAAKYVRANQTTADAANALTVS